MNFYILLLAIVIGAVTAARRNSGNLLSPAGGGQAPNRPISQTPGQYPEQPSNQYPGQPSNQYPGEPSNQYPGQPSNRYPEQPSNQYPGQPSNQYPGQPSNQYPGQPSNRYPGQPSNRYPGHPSNRYPGQPSNQYPGQEPGYGQEEPERCSASPHGRDKTDILNRYNDYFGSQDFIVSNFQPLQNPRGEFFDACVEHARNQGFRDDDLKNLFCEFGKKIGLLNGNNYSINEQKVKEWFNNLSIDQQQKESFSNSVQPCLEDFSNQNRGNTQSSECDKQISFLYTCLRQKCDDQQRG